MFDERCKNPTESVHGTLRFLFLFHCNIILYGIYVWTSSLWMGIFQRATQRPRIQLTHNIRAGAAVVSTISSSVLTIGLYLSAWAAVYGNIKSLFNICGLILILLIFQGILSKVNHFTHTNAYDCKHNFLAFIDIMDKELANASACSPRNTVNWCTAQVYDAGVFKKTCSRPRSVRILAELKPESKHRKQNYRTHNVTHHT